MAFHSRLMKSCLSRLTRLQDKQRFVCNRHRLPLSRNLATTSVKYDYDKTFNESINNPVDFWAAAAENVEWMKKWDKVLDQSQDPSTKWYVGGELNTCHNAVDRHVNSGRGDQTAIIHDSPVTNSITKITYSELLKKVQDFAGALTAMGVKKGDRVLIYMPMIPEALVAMMATARIGGIHSLVFGGFAPKELSTRIAHSQPTVVVSANFGVEPNRNIAYKPLLDAALNLIDFKPKKCVIFNRPSFEPAELHKGQDIDWNEAVNLGRPADCVPVPATDPVYILYTSGTTGVPKAIQRPSGGHAVALTWSMKNIYGIDPGQVWWAASDLGWVVGHSYIAYAPLLSGCTTIIYEGKPVGTPDPGAFFRVLHDHKVNGMFTAPTALRAIRAEDEHGDYAKKYLPLDKFQALFLAGERCDIETLNWIRNLLQAPIIDNWWQTETGWAITATCMGLGMNPYPPPGTSGKPVPGYNVKVLRSDATDTEAGELGQVYVKLPLPPGFMSTLYKGEETFKDVYFSTLPGYYDTMDAGVRSKEGYISVMSRVDDVINVAGHRLSCGSLEEAVLECGDIVDVAVIGVPDKLKGHVPLGLCVVKQGSAKSEEEVKAEVIKYVRTEIGPVAAFKQLILVPKLPKTRSGKIPRQTLSDLAAGKPFKIPLTIDDASVYPAIKASLQAVGYAPDVLAESS